MILQQNKQQTLARPAFTLMEMLVVVAIIVALAGIGGYFFLNAAARARVDTAKTQMKVLEQAIESYQLNYGQYPPNLEALFISGAKGGPYLKERRAIYDPWEMEYGYDPSGAHNRQVGNFKVDLWSQGSGQMIGNWQ